MCRVPLQCHRAMVSGGIIQIWQVVTALKRIADHVGVSGGSEKQSRQDVLKKVNEKCFNLFRFNREFDLPREANVTRSPNA